MRGAVLLLNRTCMRLPDFAHRRAQVSRSKKYIKPASVALWKCRCFYREALLGLMSCRSRSTADTDLVHAPKSRCCRSLLTKQRSGYSSKFCVWCTCGGLVDGFAVIGERECYMHVRSSRTNITDMPPRNECIPRLASTSRGLKGPLRSGLPWMNRNSPGQS